jgi:hypothetical protein
MARRKKTTEPNPESIPASATPRISEGSSASVDRERIASRAYELYVARGGTHGRDMQDWLEAEAELVRRPRAADRM